MVLIAYLLIENTRGIGKELCTTENRPITRLTHA